MATVILATQHRALHRTAVCLSGLLMLRPKASDSTTANVINWHLWYKYCKSHCGIIALVQMLQLGCMSRNTLSLGDHASALQHASSRWEGWGVPVCGGWARGSA